MLVLTRKSGQAIQIGHDIIVLVKSISGGRVSVAIQAPQAVKVLRGELMTTVTERSATS
jgi:carbon storage regulator